MSLRRPHRLWSSCGSNPFEVHKASIQAAMLTGRYPTEKLQRHWTENKSGLCSLPGCSGTDVGSLEHILLACKALKAEREHAMKLCYETSLENIPLFEIINSYLSPDAPEHLSMQFLLDSCSLPEVRLLIQAKDFLSLDKLLYVTRTWCYLIHRRRMTLLGYFKFRWHIFFSFVSFCDCG